MNRRSMLALTPAALALTVAVAAAQAQPPGPPPPAPNFGPGPRGGPPTAEMKARHEAMQKQHIEDLKTVLRLRPDQEPALQAFVAAHRPPEDSDMRRGPPESKALSTPERLDEMAKREQAMSARREQMRQALTKFYAALSPDQQKVFDALQRLQGGPMGGGRRMMHGRFGFGPGGHDGPDGPGGPGPRG